MKFKKMKTYKLKATKDGKSQYFAIGNKETRDQLASSYKVKGYKVSKSY